MSAAEEIIDTFVEMVAERVAAKLAANNATPAEPIGPVTKPEACRILGIHRATLDRAVVAGCPFEQFGDRRRYNIAAVRAWFREHKPSSGVGKDAINVDKLTKKMGLKRAGK